jgi:hypothetical protein
MVLGWVQLEADETGSVTSMWSTVHHLLHVLFCFRLSSHPVLPDIKRNQKVPVLQRLLTCLCSSVHCMCEEENMKVVGVPTFSVLTVNTAVELYLHLGKGLFLRLKKTAFSATHYLTHSSFVFIVLSLFRSVFFSFVTFIFFPSIARPAPVAALSWVRILLHAWMDVCVFMSCAFVCR